MSDHSTVIALLRRAFGFDPTPEEVEAIKGGASPGQVLAMRLSPPKRTTEQAEGPGAALNWMAGGPMMGPPSGVARKQMLSWLGQGPAPDERPLSVPSGAMQAELLATSPVLPLIHAASAPAASLRAGPGRVPLEPSLDRLDVKSLPESEGYAGSPTWQVMQDAALDRGAQLDTPTGGSTRGTPDYAAIPAVDARPHAYRGRQEQILRARQANAANFERTAHGRMSADLPPETFNPDQTEGFWRDVGEETDKGALYAKSLGGLFTTPSGPTAPGVKSADATPEETAEALRRVLTRGNGVGALSKMFAKPEAQPAAEPPADAGAAMRLDEALSQLRAGGDGRQDAMRRFLSQLKE